MVNEFCGFRHGVIGKDLPADTTLNNMKKADLIKLLHTAQHNYESLMWFYNNAVKVNMSQLNNNGWIPCSERLPDDFMSMEYLTTVKGRFYSEINYYCVVNHKWYSNERTTKEVNVIAWMPKPTVYQPKGQAND